MTRKALENWLKTNRPDLAISEVNGNKGYYKRSVGPAHRFHTCGPTWKHVAMELGAIDTK